MYSFYFRWDKNLILHFNRYMYKKIPDDTTKLVILKEFHDTGPFLPSFLPFKIVFFFLNTFPIHGTSSSKFVHSDKHLLQFSMLKI